MFRLNFSKASSEPTCDTWS